MTWHANAERLLPEIVQRMLDEMPIYSDIVEMRITEDDGPIPKRRVAIYYTQPPKKEARE